MTATEIRPVSVWIGAGESRAAFDTMLEYHIADGGLGEFQPCAFCRAFGIMSYDPDDFGGRFFSRPPGARLLLHETSFGVQVAERHPHAAGANCYVLLYNHRYDGAVREATISGFRFEFVGVYDENGERRTTACT